MTSKKQTTAEHFGIEKRVYAAKICYYDIYYTERLSKEDASHYDLDYLGYTLMEINEK